MGRDMINRSATDGQLSAIAVLMIGLSEGFEYCLKRLALTKELMALRCMAGNTEPEALA